MDFHKKYRKYKHKYLTLKNKNLENLQIGGYSANIKTYIFGDSFSEVFNLIENPEIYIKSFKGATARGIGKSNNETAITIDKIIDKKDVDCLIFYFGNVDVYFYAFYVMFVRNENIEDNPEKFISEIVYPYLKFIEKYQNKTKRIYIIAPSYSVISDKYIMYSIKKSSRIDPKILAKINFDTVLERFNLKFRNKLVDLYIQLLERIYQNNKKIKVININPLISHNGIVDRKYIVNNINHHYRWETIITHFIKLLKKCGIDYKYLTDIEKSASEYEKLLKK